MDPLCTQDLAAVLSCVSLFDHVLNLTSCLQAVIFAYDCLVHYMQ